VKRLAAAASLALLACAARAPAPPPATPPAAPAPSPPPAAAMPPAGTDEHRAAIERCKQGYAGIGAISHVDPPSLIAELARDCADIYSEPACAAAMRNAPADPSQFASTLARACRDAYCPHLPAPRPRLCDRRDLPPPTELLGQWAELHQQIFARELGIAPEGLAPLFQPMTVPAARDVTPAPPPVHVYAKTEGSHRMRVWVDGVDSITVDLYGGSKPLAALARAAHTSAAPDAQVIFACDRRLPYGAVVSVLDAFKKEGFARIALSVRPELAK